jgi:AAA ATPase domain
VGRQLLANRAGAVVTGKVRELWTDRELKIRFNLDAQHFDTLVSDPTSIYDVEVNLNKRSRGFKWFFSFYVTFTADTEDGPAEKAILLLDEPGLHLHALAQRNLLNHFANDFKNQIIFTTHSPFMAPVDELPSIRTVNIAQDTGTTVTNDPTGDERTLFPLQTAIGYDLTQTLFVGDKNLVMEAVSDFWYLITISEYLAESNRIGMPKGLTLTPAGGAQNGMAHRQEGAIHRAPTARLCLNPCSVRPRCLRRGAMNHALLPIRKTLNHTRLDWISQLLEEPASPNLARFGTMREVACQTRACATGAKAEDSYDR